MKTTIKSDYMKLIVGNIVHFYGARFEIVSTEIIIENPLHMTLPDVYMRAEGKWLSGRIVPNYFGPTKNWVFQGNDFAPIEIEK